jgi:NHLM bacteriocin system ABC transporter ATP-binding protein
VNETIVKNKLLGLIEGKTLEGSTKAILLDNPDECFLILDGGGDLFLSSKDHNNQIGAKSHLAHLAVGQLALGLQIQSDDNQILCLVPLPDTEVFQFSRESLLGLMSSNSDMVRKLLYGWFTSLSKLPISTDPRSDAQALELASDFNAAQGLIYKNNSHDFLHVAITEGSCNYLGDLILRAGESTLVNPGAWLKSVEESKFQVSYLQEFIDDTFSSAKVDNLHSSVTQSLVLSKQRFLRAENKRLEQQQHHQQQQLGSGLKLLVGIFNKRGMKQYNIDEPALILACRVVTDTEGIPFELPQSKDDGSVLTLREIEHQSIFRSREVLLRDNWWNQDHGTLVAFREEDNQPIALVQDGPNKYLAFDTGTKQFTPVDFAYAEKLKPQAYFFYRPMEDKAMTIRSLLKFGMLNSKRDMWVVLFISLLGALLGMVTPIAMALLIDNIIPNADYNQLFFIGGGLIAIAMADATFSITRGIAMQRFQGKNGMAIQCAVWDRLLALPVPFFQRYSSGELSNRANGISTIMSILSGTTSTALISGVFSVFYFFLLFYYSSKLAWIATGLVVLTIIATVIVNYIKLGFIRKETELGNKMSGLVLQLLEGVSKLRNTGAEARAFYQWSMIFAEQRPQIYKAENVTNYLETYNAVLPIISSILIFWAVVYYGAQGGETALTTGQFIAFSVAYGSFLSGMLGLTSAAMSILAIIPIYENSKPVLEAIPERSGDKHQVASLSGKIEVNNIRFRYDLDGPEVLKGVNLTIEKGEYIALVGGSGSGKSTLLRILLGFEKPEAGSIYYDDMDLNGLDIASMRRQLGVVLQNGRLMLGDLFRNIVGSAPLTLDDAWEAAEMCGLKDDIKSMPMGMSTMVSSGVMSGGQVQRLMIARAIVHRPNILFFDEATSALDNRTQAIVTKSLESLSVTRIVIAHRLSTIINADKICYLHEGQIVEEGSFDELIAKNGHFADMAKRQTL